MHKISSFINTCPMQSAPAINLPVGWISQFQPSNQQILDPYLKFKRLGHPIPCSEIVDLQIYDFHPRDLIDENCKEKYFFCLPQFHLKTRGNQRIRKAGGGVWSRTGRPLFIKREDSNQVIGTRKIFVFKDPDRTCYVLHEYEYTAQLDSPVQDDNDFVLCKLMISNKELENAKKANSVSFEKDAKKSKKRWNDIDCNKTKPNKKARNGLSYCASKQQKKVASSAFGEGEHNDKMTFNFECYDSSNLMAYSASGEVDPALNDSELGYFQFSDFENQNPSYGEVTNSTFHVGELSDIRTCDLEHQNPSGASLVYTDLENVSPNRMTSISAYEKGELNYHVASCNEDKDMLVVSGTSIQKEGDLSFPMVSDFNNHNFEEIGSILQCSVGETSYLIAGDLENQTPNEMTIISSYAIHKPGSPVSSSLENQNQQYLSKRIDVSASSEGKCSLLKGKPSDFGNQNQYEKADIFDSEYSSHTLSATSLPETGRLIAADLENQIPSEMTPISSYEIHNPGSHRSSWVENQNQQDITVSRIKEGETSYLTDFDFEKVNQDAIFSDSCNEKGMLSNLVTFDIEKQYLSERIDLSASLDGKLFPLEETPSDFEKQNRYEKADMSDSEYCGSTLSATSVQESAFQEMETRYSMSDVLRLDDLRDFAFPEIPKHLDELTVSDDLENILQF